MKITLISGDRQVHLWVKGNKPETLRRAKKAAAQLFAETSSEKKAKPQFGIQAPSDTLG